MELPVEIRHCIFGYLDCTDEASLRLVNKETHQQIEDRVVLPPYITVTSGSKWYQFHNRCHWCDDSVPFDNEFCKKFKSCSSCLDDVVKSCQNCQRYPVSVLDVLVCQRCDAMWCTGCVIQMLKLYVRSSCEFEDFWVCFYCMMSQNLLLVCDHDACDQLMCSCRSCCAERLHSDTCLLQYCCASCAQDCTCATMSESSRSGSLSGSRSGDTSDE